MAEEEQLGGLQNQPKKVSDLEREVSCDPHVSIQEKVQEPIEKDDSQEEVGCKEGDNGNEKDVNHSDMIEDFTSGDTFIRHSVEVLRAWPNNIPCWEFTVVFYTRG